MGIPAIICIDIINLNHVNDLTWFEVESCVSGQGKELHHPKRLDSMYVNSSAPKGICRRKKLENEVD